MSLVITAFGNIPNKFDFVRLGTKTRHPHTCISFDWFIGFWACSKIIHSSMNICLNPGTVLGRLQYDSDQKEKGTKLGLPFLTQRCGKVIHSSMNIVNEYLPKPITVPNKPGYLRTAATRLPWTGFPTAWSSFKKTNFWKTQALAGSTVLIVVCVCMCVCDCMQYLGCLFI